VQRWFESMRSRPAVIRAYEWADRIRNEGMTEEARKNLFGQTAASVKPA
jgi:GSH-dependent disulfide-bond oxidoreductase